MEKNYQTIIEHYIQSYNNFDIKGMIRGLHEEVIFQNVSNGKVDVRTEGIDQFKTQAEAATSYFKTRKQTITSWAFEGDSVTINIDYVAVLAIDLPNGMKAEDTLQLTGKSIFQFQNGKIIRIIDES